MKHLKFTTIMGIALLLQSCTSQLLAPTVRENYPRKKYDWESTSPQADTVKLVRIGHATTLIEVGEKTILTDPWFSEKKGYYHGEPSAVNGTRFTSSLRSFRYRNFQDVPQ